MSDITDYVNTTAFVIFTKEKFANKKLWNNLCKLTSINKNTPKLDFPVVFSEFYDFNKDYVTTIPSDHVTTIPSAFVYKDNIDNHLIFNKNSFANENIWNDYLDFLCVEHNAPYIILPIYPTLLKKMNPTFYISS